MEVTLGNPAQVSDQTRVERIGVHSHIRGLGLSDELLARKTSMGMVGQCNARKAAGLIIHMVKVRWEYCQLSLHCPIPVVVLRNRKRRLPVDVY